MSPAACPRCGGRDRRLLAPGFFECRSKVIIDLVPAGRHGSASEIPVHGVCGHRYQTAVTSGSTNHCACGMFAVGICRQCSKFLCGEHGSHDAAGGFVCVAHIHEAAARAREEREVQGREYARGNEEPLPTRGSYCAKQPPDSPWTRSPGQNSRPRLKILCLRSRKRSLDPRRLGRSA